MMGKASYRLAVLAAVAMSVAAWAGIEGEQVVSGSAKFSHDGATTTIEAGHNAIIEYQRFDIGIDQTIRFVQPDASSRVLNRVRSDDPSTIAGSLQANGIVYIVNPAGVYFTQGATVNVGGLYAGAANLSNSDFLAGINRFTDVAGNVVNHGTIEGDTLALVGRRVENFGTIRAPHGLVTLASGDEVLISDRDRRVFVRLGGAGPTSGDGSGANANGGAAEAGVTNAGRIEADGGTVVWGAGDIYAMGLHQHAAGSVKADRVDLQASGSDVKLEGAIDATRATGVGGDVAVTGERVKIDATIDASGQAGGGSIRIGGDVRGTGDLPHATISIVDYGAVLLADAIGAGDGGTIVVWADGATAFGGVARARGGSAGGDGGFVEISAPSLTFAGAVDTSAALGSRGLLLFDPTNINIVSGGGGADDGLLPDLSNATVGAGDFVISETALEALAADSNLVLEATNNITVADIADNLIELAIDGGGSVAIRADTDATGGGDVVFTDTADVIRTEGGAIEITGATLTLGGLDTTGASGAVAGGSVTLSSTGDTDLAGPIMTADGQVLLVGAGLDMSGGSIATGGGDVTIGHEAAGGILVGSIDAGAGEVFVQNIAGPIEATNAGPQIDTTTRVTLRGTTLGAPGDPITLAHATQVALDTTGSAYVDHDGTTDIASFSLTVDPVGAFAYVFNGFADESFSGNADAIIAIGGDLVINQVITTSVGTSYAFAAKSGDVYVDDNGAAAVSPITGGAGEAGQGGIFSGTGDVSVTAEAGSVLPELPRDQANVRTSVDDDATVTLRALNASAAGGHEASVGGDGTGENFVDIENARRIVVDAREHVNIRGNGQSLLLFDMTVDPDGPNVPGGGAPTYRGVGFADGAGGPLLVDAGGDPVIVADTRNSADHRDLFIDAVDSQIATDLRFATYTGHVEAAALATNGGPITLTTLQEVAASVSGADDQFRGDVRVLPGAIESFDGVITINATAADDGAGGIAAPEAAPTVRDADILIDDDGIDAGTGQVNLFAGDAIDEADLDDSDGGVANELTKVTTGGRLYARARAAIGNQDGASVNTTQLPLLDVDVNLLDARVTTAGNIQVQDTDAVNANGLTVENATVANGFVRLDSEGLMQIGDEAVVVTTSGPGAGFVWLVSSTGIEELNDNATVNVTMGPGSTLRIDAEGDVGGTSPLDFDGNGLWLLLGQDVFDNVAGNNAASANLANLRDENLDMRVLTVHDGDVSVTTPNTMTLSDELPSGAESFQWTNPGDLVVTASLFIIENGTLGTDALPLEEMVFNGPTELRADAFYEATTITYNGTIASDDTDRSLFANTHNGGTTTFTAEVGNGGTNPLFQFETNADGTTVLGADSFSSGRTAFFDHLQLAADVTVSDAGGLIGSGAYFTTIGSGAGGPFGLTVVTNTDDATYAGGVLPQVPVIGFAGDVGVDATGAATAGARLSYLRLNPGETRTFVPAVASVVVGRRDADDSTGVDPTQTLDWDVHVEQDFTMGRAEKLTAIGAVTINANLGGATATGATLSDLNARGWARVDANGSDVVLLARTAAADDRVLLPDDVDGDGQLDELVPDRGLDFFIDGNFTIADAADVIIDGPGGIEVWANGAVSGVPGGATIQQVQIFPEFIRTTPFGGTIVLDPIPVEVIDLGNVLPVFPPALVDLLQLTPVDPGDSAIALVDDSPEAAQLLAMLDDGKTTLFDPGPLAAADTASTGGMVGMGRARFRMAAWPDALDAYRRTFYETTTTPEGEVVYQPRFEQLREALARGVAAYTDATGEPIDDPAAFRSFLEQTGRAPDALAVLNALDALFEQVAELGLADRAWSATLFRIARKVNPAGLTADQLNQAALAD